MSKHPVGATWEADDGTVRVRITLETRDNRGERWLWSSNCRNWYGIRADICSSYRKCKLEIPIVNARFKRIK